MFKGINKKVKNYLRDSKNVDSTEYSDNRFADETTKLYESLVYVKENVEGFDFFNAPKDSSQFLSIPRTK